MLTRSGERAAGDTGFVHYESGGSVGRTVFVIVLLDGEGLEERIPRFQRIDLITGVGRT